MESVVPSLAVQYPVGEEDASLFATWTTNSKQHIPNCHMKWIKDLMPPLLSVEKEQKMFKQITEDVLDWFQKASKSYMAASTGMNTRLLLASYCAFCARFDDAFGWLENCLEYITTLTSETEQHLRAYRYLIEANFYLIKLMEKDMVADCDVIDLVDEPGRSLKVLDDMYDENDKSFQAVLAVAKGVLAKTMHLQETQIDMFRKATVLDPKYADWHRCLYRALRTLRRDNRPGGVPPKEEEESIKRAYELNETCCLNQACYAGMLDENTVGNRDLLMHETMERRADEIIELMTKSLEENPEDKWTNVRLAEIFAYGRYPHLDSKQGLLMFMECEQRWPEDSMVLHKFGKYYANNGLQVKAFDYYTRALENHLQNYPCLMDYLKTGCKLKLGRDDMLAMVEKCLSEKTFNKVPLMKIMTIKGLFLWLLDKDGQKKDAACRVWIDAAVKAPGTRCTMLRLITQTSWMVIGEYKVNVEELIDILEFLLARCSMDYPVELERKKRERTIKELINELKTQGFKRPEPVPALLQRNRSGSVSSLNSTRSSGSYATARSTVSDDSFSSADSVPNWRVGSARGSVFGDVRHPSQHFPPNLGSSSTRAYSNNNGYRYTNPEVTVKRRSPADFDNDWRR